MRPKVGFFLGAIAFLATAFLPPTFSMYLSAINTVLKHSHEDVVIKLFEGITLKSPEDIISGHNLQDVLNQSQKIPVYLPSDFHQSGDKGIRLKEEGTKGTLSLKQVIEMQTRGIKYTLAIALLMAIWWITEALPISIVAMNLIELKSLPTILILTAVILLAKFLSEITSNTATATMLMPILFAVGTAIGIDPLSVMIAGAVATSLVFMLPVATPPNAIVYGTEYVSISDMIRNGFILQIVTALIWICLLRFGIPALSPLVKF